MTNNNMFLLDKIVFLHVAKKGKKILLLQYCCYNIDALMITKVS